MSKNHNKNESHATKAISVAVIFALAIGLVALLSMQHSVQGLLIRTTNNSQLINDLDQTNNQDTKINVERTPLNPDGRADNNTNTPTQGDATVSFDATYTKRALTQNEKNQLTFSLYRESDSYIVLNQQSLGSYTVPANNYIARIDNYNIPDSLAIDGNPHTPFGDRHEITLNAGDNGMKTLIIDINPYREMGSFDGEHEDAAGFANVATVSFEQTLADKSTASKPGKGSVSQDSISISGENILFETVSSHGENDIGTTVSELNIYDLEDPFNPRNVVSEDVTDFLTGTYPYISAHNEYGCGPTNIQVVQKDTKAMGLMKAQCYFRAAAANYNWAWHTGQYKIMFEYDPTTENFQYLTSYDRHGHTTFEGNIQHFDMLVAGPNNTVYGIGNEVLDLTSPNANPTVLGNIPYDLKSYVQPGQNWTSMMIPFSKFGQLRLSGIIDTFTKNGTPYVIAEARENGDKLHNGSLPWTVIISLADPSNPSVEFIAADDIFITPQNNGSIHEDGADRSTYEQAITVTDHHNWLSGRYSNSNAHTIIDAVQNKMYSKYQIYQADGDSTISNYLLTHNITGSVRTGDYLGIIDASNLSNPTLQSRPVLWSMYDPEPRASGNSGAECTGVGKGTALPMVARNNLVVYHAYNESSRLKNDGGHCNANINDVVIGLHDTNGDFAWLNGSTETTKDVLAQLSNQNASITATDAEILPVDDTTYAVYIGHQGLFSQVIKVELEESYSSIDVPEVTYGNGDNSGGTTPSGGPSQCTDFFMNMDGTRYNCTCAMNGSKPEYDCTEQ